jgi:tripartite-type tricarboxylate transporter receptor subunit TctC
MPAAAGGTNDILARLVGAKLFEALKQPVVVDNRASGSGVIIAEMTAQASPDGHTLFVPYHQHTANAALNPKLPYQKLRATNYQLPVTNHEPLDVQAALSLPLPVAAF